MEVDMMEGSSPPIKKERESSQGDGGFNISGPGAMDFNMQGAGHVVPAETVGSPTLPIKMTVMLDRPIRIEGGVGAPAPSSVEAGLSSLTLQSSPPEKSKNYPTDKDQPLNLQAAYQSILNEASLPQIGGISVSSARNVRPQVGNCDGVNSQEYILPIGGGDGPWQMDSNTWNPNKEFIQLETVDLQQLGILPGGLMMKIIDASDLEGENYIEIGNPNEIPKDGQTDGSDDAENAGKGTASGNSEDKKKNNFPCAMCPVVFNKKLLLNNHMKKRHGVNFVFTERGHKVCLVRFPRQGAPESEGGESPDEYETVGLEGSDDQSLQVAISRGMNFQSHAERNNQEIETKQEIPEQEEICTPPAKSAEDDGLGVGFSVDISAFEAYRKTKERNLVPFVCFVPVGSKNSILLKVKHFNASSQLLTPATKNDIRNAIIHQSTTDWAIAMDGKLAIVAFAVQSYSKEDKSVQIAITPPTEARKGIKCPSIVSEELFITLAFSNPEQQEPIAAHSGAEGDEDENMASPPKPKRRGRKSKKDGDPEEIGEKRKYTKKSKTEDSGKENAAPRLVLVDNVPRTPKAKSGSEMEDEDSAMMTPSPKMKRGGKKARILAEKSPSNELNQTKKPCTPDGFESCDEDAEFVPNVTSAPKRPKPIPRRIGRPRKLKFEDPNPKYKVKNPKTRDDARNSKAVETDEVDVEIPEVGQEMEISSSSERPATPSPMSGANQENITKAMKEEVMDMGSPRQNKSSRPAKVPKTPSPMQTRKKSRGRGRPRKSEDDKDKPITTDDERPTRPRKFPKFNIKK